MNKHFYQRKTGISALALSLFLMISFLLSPFMFPVSMSNRLAKAETAVEEQISSYLAGYGITDEEMDAQAERIASTYSQYVDFEPNGRYLSLDPSLYDAEYRDAVEERNFDFDGANFTNEELAMIGDMRTIYTNISIMNALVDEELGYIDQYGEFIFTQFDSTMTARLRAWGYSIKWYKLSINLDSDLAIVFAAISLVTQISLNWSDLGNVIRELTDRRCLETCISGICATMPDDTYRAVAYFSASKILEIYDILSVVSNAISEANVLNKVINIIMSYLLPELDDCIIVLYKALRFNHGAKLTMCWVPFFGTKFGLSIKTFR